MNRAFLPLALIGLLVLWATSDSHAQEIASADYARVNAALVVRPTRCRATNG